MPDVRVSREKKHFMRRPAFWIGISVVVLANIPAGYLIYGTIAKRALTDHIDDLNRAGDSLQIEDHLPKPVSNADDNFAEAPIVRAIRGLEQIPASASDSPFEINPPSLKEMEGYEIAANETVRYHRGKPLNNDFPALSEIEAAEAILSYYAPLEDELSALASAAGRPHSNFDLDYDLGFLLTLPEISKIQEFAKVYNYRAKAYLKLGRSDQAADEICTLIALSQHISRESTLIHQLVSAVFFDMAISILHEGFREEKWSLNHLSRFEKQLEATAIAEGFLRAFRMERAMFASLLSSPRGRQSALQGSGYGKLAPYIALLPEGWFYDNIRFYSETFQKEILTDSSGKILTESLPTTISIKSSSSLSSSPLADQIRYGLTSLTLPAFNGFLTRFQRCQTLLDHARIAIALEKKRIIEGQYPESLATIADEFDGNIPSDLFTGIPYAYKLLVDGSYLIYGVGPDNIDNGGRMKHDREKGDWVWRLTLPDDFDYQEYRSRD